MTTSESKDEVSLPIWRRTSLGMKHIRGIFLEEDKQLKQYQSKIETNNSPSKSASSSNVSKSPIKSTQPLSGANKTTASTSKTYSVGSPKLTGKNSSNEVSKPPLLKKVDESAALPGVWVCPKCQKYKTKNPNDLIIHIHNEYNYRRYKCKLCDHKCVTENSLKGHIIGDHQVSYNYSLCDLLPQDNSVEDYVRKCLVEQLAAGKGSEKISEQADDNNLKCKHCHMMFASYHNYRTHILAKHVAANRFSCKYCPLAFWNEGIAKQHHFRSTHASKPFAVIRNEELEAKLTPEFWFTEYGIPISKSVKYSAMGSTILHCDQCMFKTNQSFKLVQHKMSQHQTIPDEPVVNEDIETDNDIGPEIIDLTSDMQTTSIKSAPSISTSSSVILDSDLSSVKKQRADKPNVYKCFHCNKNCFTAKGMRQHWLKHHSSNQGLECSYYEFKCFKDSMQMLPGIELMCPYCPHSENSIAGMRVHNSISHADKHFRLKRRELSNTTILVCALCEYQGRTFNSIKKHSDQHHPGKLPLFTKLELTPVERICTPMGKLIEDKVMYGCSICSCDYPSPFTFKQHIKGRENHEECDPIVKYNRCVIQENVEIPQDEDLDVVTGDENFKCPSCTYETEDRNVMIQNHLATHIKAFICPLCDHGFEISLDTLFHIRHYHHDARQTPVCNKSAYMSYVALKDDIVVTYRSDSDTRKTD